MKKIYLLPFFALLIGLTACNEHYYAPALYKNDMVYQFKPMSSDSAKSATYVSGAVNLASGSYQSDDIIIGQLHLDRANTFENLNVAYGAYGFAGSYSNTTNKVGDPGYFDTKFIGGFGLNASANIFVASGRADYRVIGLAAAYSNEFGDYADFRKKAQALSGYYTDASTSIFTAGFTNETIWHGKSDPSIQQGYRVFLGQVFGNHDYVNALDPKNTQNSFNNTTKTYVSATYFLQVHRYHVAVDVQNFVALNIQFGYRF